MGAVKLLEKWNMDIEKKVDAALGNTPVIELEWRTFGPQKPRRLRE